MADSRGKRRRNSVTRLLEDVFDDTKDLVDDVLDRTKDLERDGRRAARRVMDEDDDRETTSAGEIDSLKAALEDLTAKVARLAELQAQAQAQSEPKDT